MIIECSTLKDCREALYKAYESQSNLVLDLRPSVDADEVPVIVVACEECNADKILEKLSYKAVHRCPVCGADVHREHTVNMIVQGDSVVYRWQDNFNFGGQV